MGDVRDRRGAAIRIAIGFGVALCLSLFPSAATAAVQPGEIFVADPEAGPGAKGAILRVDRATGAQSVVSSGGQFENPVGVAIGGTDALFVADADALGGTGAVFAVDPSSGAQRVVASGGRLEEPTGIASNGFVIAIADPDSTPPGSSGIDGQIIFVNPSTGAQSSGPAPITESLSDPMGVSITNGLVFTDANSGEGGGGVVYAQSLVTRGAFITFSIASGGNLVDPFGITQVPSGFGPERLVVADPSSAGGSGAVIGLSEPQHVWSSGGSLSDPTGVAFRPGPPSELLVVDQTADGSGSVLKIDPRSGAQAPVSSGGRFSQPTGIAVAAPLCNGVISNKPGSDGPDDISGGGIVAALGGDDSVSGDDSDDLVCGDEGNDRIRSAIGVALSYGDDEYLGGDGDDRLIGGFMGARDKLAGEAGDDKVVGNGGRDRVSGGDGDDRVSGGNGNDRVGGGKGADVVRGGEGNDRLRGGKGRDLCIGSKGDDSAAGCERRRKI